MCTVSYVPAEDGFVLTSNRDETPTRSAEPPRPHPVGDQVLLFPREPLKGGTWIAASRSRVVCLLNGAFIKHSHRPPYRISRGIMLLDSFGYSDDYAFAGRYDFGGIEPFTLVWVADQWLSEIRWDGKALHHTPLSAFEPHIWASATLYPPEIQTLRRTWFSDFVQKTISPVPTEISALPMEILGFHTTPKGIEPENDIVMQRPLVRTVSATSFQRRENELHFWHKDLMERTDFAGVW